MKVKTSITLDSRLMKMIDRMPAKPSRSEVIEEALVLYFKGHESRRRDRSDAEILGRLALELNEEALDTLDFQSAAITLRAAEPDSDSE